MHPTRVGNEPDEFVVNDGTDPMRFVAFWVVQIEAGLQCSRVPSRTALPTKSRPITDCPGPKAPKPSTFSRLCPIFGAGFDFPDHENARSVRDELNGI